MLKKDFFEKSPLYVKYKIKLEDDEDKLKYPSLNMFCSTCNSKQTFSHNLSYGKIIRPYMGVTKTQNAKTPIAGETILIEYICAGCKNFKRYFMIYISKNLDYVTKSGQFPEFDIDADKNTKKMLGKNINLFNRGRICEVHGYGIGAFIYYRRIIEVLIDDLIEKIWNLYTEKDKERYKDEFKKIKESKIAEEKINIAKNILPDSLYREGYNPLKTIYDVLSKGIHNKDDKECLIDAEIIREILIPLINQVITTDESQKQIKDGIKKLLKMENTKNK